MTARTIKGIKIPTYRNISVTQEIIENSVRGDSQACMVRWAVKYHIPEALRIVVDITFVAFTIGNVRYRYSLPKKAAYALASFEAGEQVEPFVFTLESRHGEVHAKTPAKKHPGSATSIRLWAVSRSLMTQEQADEQQRIPQAIKDAYLAEHPETAEVVNNRRPGNTRLRTRQAQQNIRQDRFYGLKLQNGFAPGGAPL